MKSEGLGLPFTTASRMRSVVDGCQNPQRLLLQHSGQIGALAFPGRPGILPFGVEGQAYQAPVTISAMAMKPITMACRPFGA